MRARVLATDLPVDNDDLLRTILAAAGVDLTVADQTDPQRLMALAADADAIMTCFAQVPGQVLEAATRCQTVARFGVGVDNIDVTHATEKGMVVSNVPDYCGDEVADHVLLMMLALARRLPAYLAGEARAAVPTRLAGETLGIVGLGDIGARMVARGLALGMRVLAVARSSAQIPGVTFVPSLDELLSASDVVTLHVPLTEQTRGLISAAQLARMKPTAVLLNAARGPLVDTDALVHALESGALGGAGLDVTDPEPLPMDHALRRMPNVIITPHVAYASDGSLRELVTRAAGNVIDVLQGRTPASVVNPEVLDNPQRRARAGA